MKNNLIVKHNQLIEARYDLTLNEQKIILYSASQLDRKKERFNILSFNIREFFKLIGTTQERYTEIREIIKSLRSKEITIKKQNSELITGWLSSIEYLENEGIIELEFSEKLIPYLLQLKEKFTRYDLKNIINLQNKYSIRVYELLKQYEKIGTREIEIKEFRKYLGIEENEYKKFSNFENRILKTTKEEINTYTDLNFDYKKIKTGRTITSILFQIDPKDQEKEIYIEYLNQSYDIKEFKNKSGLEKENFDSQQIINLYEIAVEKLIDEYENETDLFEYIKINYLFMLEKDNIRNKFAYLKKALREDFACARGQIKLDFKI